MKLFRRKKITVNEKPFAFKRGEVYVLELNKTAFTSEEVAALTRYFRNNDITVQLMMNNTDSIGIYPVESRERVEKL